MLTRKLQIDRNIDEPDPVLFSTKLNDFNEDLLQTLDKQLNETY